MNEVTRILSAIDQGDVQATEQLLPLVYDELRKLAAAKLAHEKSGQTLQATALVHEAYLRLVGPDQGKGWNSRGHFFAAAAEAMRRILVDGARRKASAKHGGQLEQVAFDEDQAAVPGGRLDLLVLNDALDQLTACDRRKAEFRFFAGLTLAQAAEALGISASTADSDWAYAKAWLRLRIAD